MVIKQTSTNGTQPPAPIKWLEQLTNPNHVYIRLSNGRLMRHSETSETAVVLIGTPIRFTRLAAERLLTSKVMLYEGATLTGAE